MDRRLVGIPAEQPKNAPFDLVSSMNRAWALGAITAEATAILDVERINFRITRDTTED